MTWLEWVAIPIAAHLILFGLSMWHWRLVPAIFWPKDQLPAILLKPHTDWWWPLSLIPRSLSALMGGRGDPVKLFGTNPSWAHHDVPQPGKWVVTWPYSAAWRTRGSRIFGYGLRRDYQPEGKYWTLRFVFGRKL